MTTTSATCRRECDFFRAGAGWVCVGRDAVGNVGGISAPGMTRALAYDEYLSRFGAEADDIAMERAEEIALDGGQEECA